MPGWDFSRYKSAVADCGRYRGPWPPSAPVWASLAKLSARFPYEDIEISYSTALGSPGGDPARFDFFDDPAELAVTYARIGSSWTNDYSDYPRIRHSPQLSWDAPSYRWDYDETPPFGLDPPRQPGIRLFVLISWNGTGIADAEITAAIGALSPLSMVPANFADGGSGPDAWPLGIWSDWYPAARQLFTLYDFNSAAAWIDATDHFTETYWTPVFGDDLTACWHAAAAGAQEQLLAAIPDLTRGDVGTHPQLSIVTSSLLNSPSPGVQVMLSAWQSAIALDVHALPPPLDLYNTEPDGLEAALSGPPPDYPDYRDAPYLWGSEDPYTAPGTGYQWEQRQALRFAGLLDGAKEGQLGFVLRNGSAPYLGDQPPPPCPIRVYAREYTGPATGWLAEDGDAYHLGTYAPGLEHGWWSTGYAFQWSDNQPEPFSEIPWDRFWLVCTPDFAFAGGALPDIPAWSDPASWNFFGGGYGGYTAAYGSCYSNYYYSHDQNFPNLFLQGNYLVPRWRLYKPALSLVAPATRLSQRADGQGITPAVRLRGPNYPRSEQSDATRRVGARNTFA